MTSARVEGVLRALLFSTVLLALPAGVFAQSEVDCSRCHEDVVLTSPAHGDVECTDCHTGITERPRRGRGHEDLVTEPCTACHSRVERQIGRSVHHTEDSPACTDCHGDSAHDMMGPESLESPLAPDNQIRTCGQCHEPMMEGYLGSVHARALLVSGLVSAPACTDCHGDHGIEAHTEEGSATSHQKSPETCGSCHAGILRTWTESAHGKNWEEDGEGPVCATCHTAHSIHRPLEAETRLHFPDECGDCHGELYSSYRGSFHGRATDLGLEASAICSDCHTPHANLPASDPASSIHPDNLGETCGACHGEVSQAFLTFDPHSDPTNKERSAEVYYVWLFMTALLIGVFGFFFLHDALWLQRSLVGMLRGEFKSKTTGSGPHVQRFRKKQIWTHVVVVVTFLLLAATGLPLKFHGAAWAQTLIDFFGGLEVARYLHRVAAVFTFGYFLVHIFDVLNRAFRKREGGMFWGANSMVPQPHDIKELFQNLRFFLYLGPRPEGGRWGYWEKFDYMAVFWGVPIIGGSGLLLWFPDFFAGFLPGWTLNVAHVVHSDEALLATGFIFVFHFFHTHLLPESFPMDPVVLTGRMPLERFREERPLEYQQLVENGELESRMVDPPTEGELRRAYIFGFTALGAGLLLAVAIFWALFGQLAH